MRRKILVTTALLSCFMLIMAVADGLAGKWKGTIKTPDGHGLQIFYVFKVDGDKLTGTVRSPEGVFDIFDGKITDNTFAFKNLGVDGDTYFTKGKMYADSCGIDIDYNDGLKDHFTIVRDTSK